MTVERLHLDSFDASAQGIVRLEVCTASTHNIDAISHSTAFCANLGDVVHASMHNVRCKISKYLLEHLNLTFLPTSLAVCLRTEQFAPYTSHQTADSDPTKRTTISSAVQRPLPLPRQLCRSV